MEELVAALERCQSIQTELEPLQKRSQPIQKVELTESPEPVEESSHRNHNHSTDILETESDRVLQTDSTQTPQQRLDEPLSEKSDSITEKVSQEKPEQLPKPVTEELSERKVNLEVSLQVSPPANSELDCDRSDASESETLSNEASKPAIDQSVIERFHELFEERADDFIQNMVHVFLEESPKRLVNLATAIATDDVKKMTLEAHTLNGSCGTLGAFQMAKLCQEIEVLGRNQTTEGAFLILDRVNREYKRVNSELERI
ncbi:MAG: Hpt domain-containing protein [Cyanobacteriota bacterium]|nr:Hpt domain-containing protein [Cyanobacteriota bacterium]